MAGAYCMYCDQRCFVDREIWKDGTLIWAGHMATCRAGKERDRKELWGIDCTTAHNPRSTNKGKDDLK